ncbi:MAG TPA: glycoside hydrolase family 30 beta sandwich domain-containing protein [Rhodanobacter sp.]|jgi:glucosylceramidase|nr:glycoside hydrolase family 30 beta sandwich domain-containing protein [Rhodanobacter sp.]
MQPARSARTMGERGGVARWLAIGSIALISMLALAALRLSGRAPPLLELPPSPILRPSGPAAGLWLSTQDRRLRLARQPDVEFSVTGPTPADVVIDIHKTYQTIDGFGAALTDASAWLLQNRLNVQQRRTLLRELFGPPPGLAFNLARLTIGASDFSLQPYTLDDLPAGDTDPGLQHFNVAANLRDVIPTVRDVLSINPNLKIIASPWSAPAWMKTNADVIGGSLLEQYESTYAQYLVRYLDAYRNHGIPIFALTVQNEPGFLPLTYPGMELSGTQRARIIARYLGPALAGRKPATRILGWDHNWDEPKQPLGMLANPDAARYIDGIAWHCYRGAANTQTEVHAAYPRKHTYITECSGGDWESSTNGELMWFARNLLLGGLRNWARGVVYWNLALDEQHGPHFGGCGTCKGIVTIDSQTGAVSRNDEYYAFAHFSRFVLPGAVRVWSTDTGNDVKNVAFQNASGGSVVMVLINDRADAHAVSVQQGNVHFQYTMPAQSVATFVWSPGQANAPAGKTTSPVATKASAARPSIEPADTRDMVP